RHIQACDQCLRELEAARDVTAALSMLSTPPNDLRERIRSRRAAGQRVLLPFESDVSVEVDAKTARKVRNRRWWRPAGLAVASVMLAALGAIVLNGAFFRWSRDVPPRGYRNIITPSPIPVQADSVPPLAA